MAASFCESLEEKSSRLFFVVGCWMIGVDEVLRGGRMGYYFVRIGLIRLIRQIRLIGLIRQIRLIGLIKQIGIIGLMQLGLIVHKG